MRASFDLISQNHSISQNRSIPQNNSISQNNSIPQNNSIRQNHSISQQHQNCSVTSFRETDKTLHITFQVTAAGIDMKVTQTIGSTSKAHDIQKDDWIASLSCIKWLVIGVDIDLSNLRPETATVFEKICSALSKDIQLTLEMVGQGSIPAPLFYSLAGISLLDLDGNRGAGWSGGAIHHTWYGSEKTRPPLLRLTDVSPRRSNTTIDPKLRPSLISNRVAVIISHVHGQYLKVRISSVSGIKNLAAFLKEREKTEIGDMTIDIEDRKFPDALTELRKPLTPFKKFVVQAVNENPQRHGNCAALADGVSTIYYSDGKTSELLRLGHTIKLTLGKQYGKKGKEAVVKSLAKSLARWKKARHLILDDSVGLLEKTIKLRKEKKYSDALANLETVVVYRYDAKQLADLPKLPAIEDIQLQYKESENDAKAEPFKKMMDSLKDWSSKTCDKSESVQCIGYEHKKRKEARQKKETDAANAVAKVSAAR